MSVDGMWYVKLADGDVERVTLDQLDDAFQNGRVDENSMVLADGSDKWMKLADLLGLSDGAAPPAPQAKPAVMQAPVTMPPLTGVKSVPAPVVVQAPVGTLPAVLQAPAAALPAPSIRPVAMPLVPTASLRPVSVDLGGPIEMGDPQFRASSRKRWVVGMLGTALVLGAGAFFVVSKAGPSASADPPPTFAAAAVQAPAEPVSPAPPPPAAAPPPQATNPGPSSVMDPTQRLTDDQKKKLLDAEKTAKSHTKVRSSGSGAASRTKDKSSSAFTTTGNKFDPLNSSL